MTARSVSRAGGVERSMHTITVINPFEVPDTRKDEALGLWDEAAAFLSAQDGYVSARLHRSVDPAARFHLVTVAEWETAGHFATALARLQAEGLDRGLADFPSSPGVYEVVRRVRGAA